MKEAVRLEEGEFEQSLQVSLKQKFDAVAKVCMKSVENDCLPGFLASPQYKYVLALKVKESTILGMEDFKAVRVLAQGRFGQNNPQRG